MSDMNVHTDGHTGDQQQLGKWLKGLIRATIADTPAEHVLARVSKRDKAKLSELFEQYDSTIEQYTFTSPLATWVYRYHRKADILYLESVFTSPDLDEEASDTIYRLFITSTPERPIRPTRQWTTHDMVFNQRGYFMRMSGSMSQYKPQFRWDQEVKALALVPDNTLVACWHDVYSESELPDHVLNPRSRRIAAVQQQVTGEWRIFTNVPLDLLPDT